MPQDQMLQCEQKKLFVVNGRKELRWAVTEVTKLTNTEPSQIRCMHCHGAVQVHRQRVNHGPRDHVEHRSRQDSEHCRGGSYFNGIHRISLAAIE